MEIKYRLLDVLKKCAPLWARRYVRAHYSLREFDRARRYEADPNLLLTSETFEGSPVKLGIVMDTTQSHRHYIAACREVKISYEVLDLLADDWIDRFTRGGYDAFLIWPSASGSMIKAAFDMRLKILEEDMGMRILPTWKECWLTEYKPRLRDWLQVHKIPHPKSWVFYDYEAARDFCLTAPLPIVVKTAIGASGSGVRIIKRRAQLMRLARQYFSSGVQIRAFEPWDKQKGYLFLQEYLADAAEWRMVRIGDSFFGYRKEKGDDGKHSASHKWSWLDPGGNLLNLTKRVTDVQGFKSMNVDIFKLPDGRLLVNECQTVFGCTTPAIQMKINDQEGRYLFEDGAWRFEAGEFSAHHLCNLRLQHLLGSIDRQGRDVVKP